MVHNYNIFSKVYKVMDICRKCQKSVQLKKINLTSHLIKWIKETATRSLIEKKPPDSWPQRDLQNSNIVTYHLENIISRKFTIKVTKYLKLTKNDLTLNCFTPYYAITRIAMSYPLLLHRFTLYPPTPASHYSPTPPNLASFWPQLPSTLALFYPPSPLAPYSLLLRHLTTPLQFYHFTPQNYSQYP